MDMGSLLIKFSPSGDPEAFKQAFSRYLTMLSGLHQVRFVVTIRNQDGLLSTPQFRTWLETRSKNADIEVHYGDYKGPVDATNAYIKCRSSEIVLIASEEMVPTIMGYDHHLISLYIATFPNFDGAIKFWDGIRPKEDPKMTMPVLGSNLLMKLGAVYHAEYSESFYQEDLTMTCIQGSMIVRCDFQLFEPGGLLNTRQSELVQLPTQGDTALYRSRHDMQFPIPFK
jgi:hypothetical protein